MFGPLNSLVTESVTGSIATQMITLRVKFFTPIHSRNIIAATQKRLLKNRMPNRFLMVLVIEVIWFRRFSDDWFLASGLDDTHLHGDCFSKCDVLQCVS